MLQNALMWKVNQEFAHAQNTLDDIRCVRPSVRPSVRAKDDGMKHALLLLLLTLFPRSTPSPGRRTS